MFTEIVKIIEGGLVGDREKVFNYSRVLAKNAALEGNEALAKRINSTLDGKRGKLVSLDSFATKPVDMESRMEMLDISYPSLSPDQLILKKHTKEEIDAFIASYQKKDKLLLAGLDPYDTLLLYGPPGCGKTTIAQYIASAIQLPLLTIRLDSLISSLLGSSAKNIRKVFDYAAQRDAILFLDEFDVIAKVRDDKNELGELKRVVNTLLQNIDQMRKGNILIAATNHQELLDPAVWRRFSKVLSIEYPEDGDIEKLLYIFMNQKCSEKILTQEKQKNILISALQGLSPSAIKTIIENTVRHTLLADKDTIEMGSILREIYLHKFHEISDDEFIHFLLCRNISHRDINTLFNFPLRKIQEFSKKIKEEGHRNV